MALRVQKYSALLLLLLCLTGSTGLVCHQAGRRALGQSQCTLMVVRVTAHHWGESPLGSTSALAACGCGNVWPPPLCCARTHDDKGGFL